MKTLSVSDSSRYRPIKSITQGGIILLQDTQNGTEEEIVEVSSNSAEGTFGNSGSATSSSTNLETFPHAAFEIDTFKY